MSLTDRQPPLDLTFGPAIVSFHCYLRDIRLIKRNTHTLSIAIFSFSSSSSPFPLIGFNQFCINCNVTVISDDDEDRKYYGD